MIRSVARIPAVAWAILALAALAAPAAAAPLRLVGEVDYSERIELPAGAALFVQLVDLTRSGTPTPIAAEAAIDGPGGAPLQFTLDFDSDSLDPSHAYGLVAEIRSGTTLWFRNPQAYPVDPLAAAATPIRILVSFVGQQIRPAAPPETRLYGLVWKVGFIGEKAMAESPEMTLSIAEDGRAGGNGGCNNYFAQARIDGEALDFSAIASTRMACAREAMLQEAEFFSTLETVARFALEDSDLVLLDGEGKRAITLSPAADAPSR